MGQTGPANGSGALADTRDRGAGVGSRIRGRRTDQLFKLGVWTQIWPVRQSRKGKCPDWRRIDARAGWRPCVCGEANTVNTHTSAQQEVGAAQAVNRGPGR